MLFVWCQNGFPETPGDALRGDRPAPGDPGLPGPARDVFRAAHNASQPRSVSSYAHVMSSTCARHMLRASMGPLWSGVHYKEKGGGGGGGGG